jgi:hypothetical protein
VKAKKTKEGNNMKCLACDGEMVKVSHNGFGDTRTICRKCGAIMLWNKTEVFAKSWCNCKETKPEQELFWFKENGSHGWLHTICGQITQTG